MAAVAVTTIDRTGKIVAMQNAAAGDTVVPGIRTFLRVTNTSGGTITVTVVQQVACNLGGATPVHDISVAVATATTREIGPIDPSIYARASDGLAVVNYSSTPGATLQVGAYTS